MRFWVEFFRDERFSFSFKIANFIMQDSLRIYLASDCKTLREVKRTGGLTDSSKARINTVISDLSRLMYK